MDPKNFISERYDIKFLIYWRFYIPTETHVLKWRKIVSSAGKMEVIPSIQNQNLGRIKKPNEILTIFGSEQKTIRITQYFEYLKIFKTKILQ